MVLGAINLHEHWQKIPLIKRADILGYITLMISALRLGWLRA